MVPMEIVPPRYGEQLQEFRKGDKGKRFDPVMYASVQNLSDQDFTDLAAFYSQQKRSPGATKADYVKIGERIYRGGNPKTGVPACAACHGPVGNGNIPAGFPPLGGQNADYLIDQLKRFKSGARTNGPNAIMNDISKLMTDEEMQAVSNYAQGLHE